MTDLVQAALDFGFSHAALLDPARLRVLVEVRQMCAADRCQAFNRSWSCPPASGTLEESRATIACYHTGLIVQTTAVLDDSYDYETMMAAGEEQKQRLIDFREELWPSYPDLITLGNGACTICSLCTYPNAPCRYPDRMVQSMEAFGLVVSDVCTDNNLGYYYGPSTITYTGCYLLA
ncbi:MAG: DUF2284 domain-containing protein [Propionibacteriaceae bacterium]|jgi:predicted metal-binding protein|nr:DUF2284 domain-containing protein [Propionibacteriaceae bacterium]